MPRRDWDSLSSDYRNRLERGGISRSEYESGASVSAARGHAHTPERPERASKDIGRYGGYLANRNDLIDEAYKLKWQLWGDSPKWHPKRAKKALQKKSIASLKRVIKRLKAVNNGTFSEDEDYYDPKDDDALYYH